MGGFIYKNREMPISKRVKDLMDRMTLNQKVRQLSGLRVLGVPEPEHLKDGLGGVNILYTLGSPRELAAQIRECQNRIRAATPFGIPAIFHCEALNGPLHPGCAAFPAPLALGAAFEPDLVKDMAKRSREQLINIGIRHALSPVFDLARDFRFGRTNEHYSSAPVLVSAMACAFVEGLQGNDLRQGVAATGKHFIGFSFAEGGLHISRVQTDWRDLRENFALPFEAAIRRAGLRSVMNGYSAYNGLPVCMSEEILTGLLREDLGFEGLVVSDYSSIDMLLDHFKTAENKVEAGIQALTAGIDMEFPNTSFYGPELREAVKSGILEERYIDRAVCRVLTFKFELGLFDEIERDYIEIDNREHDIQSKLVSEKVITLIKNDGILPLKNREIKLAIIGPTGNNIRYYNGSYTYAGYISAKLWESRGKKQTMEGVKDNGESQAIKHLLAQGSDVEKTVDDIIRQEHGGVKTFYEAAREIFPDTVYVRGCDINSNDTNCFDVAMEAAAKADVVIMTVGGKNGWDQTCTSGEGIDSADITLPGKQMELIQKVFSVNKNMVIVHTDHKPLVDTFVYENIPAIIEGWLPGIYGGNALASCIAGIVNPGGKLPVDIPRSVGQQPLYFYQYRGSRSDDSETVHARGYRDISSASRFPFGYGLSYTTFSYSNGALTKAAGTDGIPLITISIIVMNSGGMKGEEVVQLYGIDEIATVTRPQKELVGFKRISLESGEAKKVIFTFRLDQFAFINAQKKWVLEKGAFCFYIGKGANERVYETKYIQEQTLFIDYKKRGFFADAEFV